MKWDEPSGTAGNVLSTLLSILRARLSIGVTRHRSLYPLRALTGAKPKTQARDKPPYTLAASTLS